jgi:DNA-binding transcriptional LysR family regulator
MPPPWASLRVELDQMFYREGLHPPVDIVESASFLAQISFLQKRHAAAFMSQTVALHFQRQGLLKVLALKVPIELPAAGIITVRGKRATPSTKHLVDCLRHAAKQKT